MNIFVLGNLSRTCLICAYFYILAGMIRISAIVSDNVVDVGKWHSEGFSSASELCPLLSGKFSLLSDWPNSEQSAIGIADEILLAWESGWSKNCIRRYRVRQFTFNFFSLWNEVKQYSFRFWKQQKTFTSFCFRFFASNESKQERSYFFTLFSFTNFFITS